MIKLQNADFYNKISMEVSKKKKEEDDLRFDLESIEYIIIDNANNGLTSAVWESSIEHIERVHKLCEQLKSRGFSVNASTIPTESVAIHATKIFKLFISW